jgi:hypothetical protein
MAELRHSKAGEAASPLLLSPATAVSFPDQYFSETKFLSSKDTWSSYLRLSDRLGSLGSRNGRYPPGNDLRVRGPHWRLTLNWLTKEKINPAAINSPIRRPVTIDISRCRPSNCLSRCDPCAAPMPIQKCVFTSAASFVAPWTLPLLSESIKAQLSRAVKLVANYRSKPC